MLIFHWINSAIKTFVDNIDLPQYKCHPMYLFVSPRKYRIVTQ